LAVSSLGVLGCLYFGPTKQPVREMNPVIRMMAIACQSGLILNAFIP
jgi:hypothetical protein